MLILCHISSLFGSWSGFAYVLQHELFVCSWSNCNMVACFSSFFFVLESSKHLSPHVCVSQMILFIQSAKKYMNSLSLEPLCWTFSWKFIKVFTFETCIHLKIYSQRVVYSTKRSLAYLSWDLPAVNYIQLCIETPFTSYNWLLTC